MSTYMENGRLYNNSSQTQVKYTEDELEKKKTELSNWSINKSKFFFPVKISEQVFTVNPFEDTVYVITDFNLIRDFIEICDLLKADGYIDFKDVQITKKIAGIFSEKHSTKNSESLQPIEINGKSIEVLKNNSFGFLGFNPLSNATIYKKDVEYADEILKENTTLISLCKDYLGKQIIVKNSLQNFIKNGYVSFEEFAFRKQIKLNRNAFYISIAALLISIIFSFASIFITINSNNESVKSDEQNSYKQNKILVEIIDILDKINEKKEGVDTEDLQEIKEEIVADIIQYLEKDKSLE